MDPIVDENNALCDVDELLCRSLAVLFWNYMRSYARRMLTGYFRPDVKPNDTTDASTVHNVIENKFLKESGYMVMLW